MKIQKNFLVVTNYNNDIAWVPAYTDRYVIYDRSENPVFPQTLDAGKIIKSPNVGYNLYDYFRFIIDNYDQLPGCTIFVKGNCFPRHVQQQYFDRVMNNEFFTPIIEPAMHKPYWPVCFFAADGSFCEINNSWYLDHHPTKYFHAYNDFLRFCFKDPVIPRYNCFAPGANYIVPKANIRKLPKIFYQNLLTFVSHGALVGEAHIVERALQMLWTASFEISEQMLRPVDPMAFVPVPRAVPPRPSLLQRVVTRFSRRPE